MPAPENLPTKERFKEWTKGKVLTKRKTIRIIDHALEEWHRSPSLDSTIGVYKACRFFIKAKQDKDSKNAKFRTWSAQQLIKQCLEWINYYDPNIKKAFDRFENRKKLGAHKNTKSLAGVYMHERSAYLKNDKLRAPSATQFADPMNMSEYWENYGIGRGKDWEDRFKDLSEEEFLELDQLTNGSMNVTYLKKFERFRYMACWENNCWQTFDGNVINTTPYNVNDGTGGWPYAMDRYGNLFTVDPVNRGGIDMLNHSTFNAGNEVVCAGVLSIANGQLTMINNESGHYKPGQKNLFDCVQLLRKDMASKWCTAMVILGLHSQNGKQVYRFSFNNFPANGLRGGIQLL